LANKLESLKANLKILESPDFQAPKDLTKQTADWARNTKQLHAKIAEYSDRLTSLSTGADAQMDIVRIVEEEQEITRLRREVERLEVSLQGFEGLPMDREKARKEVQRVERVLEALKSERDALFEGLVDR